MAKDDFDLDFGSDFDFDKEMDKMSGGSSYSAPPKNAREATLSTLKDGGRGFISGFKGDGMGDLTKKVLKASIPSKLSVEYGDMSGAYEEVKGELAKNIQGLKSDSKKAIDAMRKLVPGDNKLSQFLAKISGKLGDDPQKEQQLSKEQQQQNEINAALLASLGEQRTLAQQQEAVRQQMENERHISSTALMKDILAEAKIANKFNMEISNNYYRKSLEIQFKQLYTQQELLGVTKTGFETFKNQFEAIAKNTGLPEIVKIKSSEQLLKSFGDKFRKDLVDTFYKDFDPFRNIKDNMIKRIRGSFDGFREGLSGATMMAEMAADQNEMMNEYGGMSKSSLLGSLVGDFVRNKLVGKVTNKFWDTKYGKQATANIKDAMLDPDGFLKSLQKKGKGGDASAIQRLLGKIAGGARNFTRLNTAQNQVNFDKDLNSPAIFDIRFKDTVVKVIPGLLGMILGEIKATRLGGDAGDHSVTFDHTSQSFMNQKDMKLHLTKSIATKFKQKVGGSLSTIMDLFKKSGGADNLTANEFKSALVQYLYDPRSRIDINAFIDNDFLMFVTAPMRPKIVKAIKALNNNLTEDADKRDLWNMAMKNLKAGLPNLNQEAQDLINTGNASVASSLGLINRNKFTGSMTSNLDGQTRFITDVLSLEGYGDDSQLSSLTAKKRWDEKLEAFKKGGIGIKAGTKDFFTDLKGAGKEIWDKVKPTVNKMKEDVASSTKAAFKEFDDFMSGNTSFTETTVYSKYEQTKKKLKKVQKEQMKNLKQSAVYKRADAATKKFLESELKKTLDEKYEQLEQMSKEAYSQVVDTVKDKAEATMKDVKARMELEKTMGSKTGKLYGNLQSGAAAVTDAAASAKRGVKDGIAAAKGKYSATRTADECALYVRKALDKAGLNNGQSLGHAYEYNQSLPKIGFVKLDVPIGKYKPQNGDIAVFDKGYVKGVSGSSEYTNHEYGHVCIYENGKWVSDHVQDDMSPFNNKSRRILNQIVTLWRHPEYGKKGSRVVSQTSPANGEKGSVSFGERGAPSFNSLSRSIGSFVGRAAGNVVNTYENRGEHWNRFKENISSGKDFITSLGESPEARKEAWEGLKNEFFNSKAYATGKVKDFKEYLRANGYNIDDKTYLELTKQAASDAGSFATREAKTLKKFLKDKWLAYYEKMSDPNYDPKAEQKEDATKLKDDQLKSLRQEFFNSEEYKSGAVQEFTDWLRALGYKIGKKTGLDPLIKGVRFARNVWNSGIFKKTRALDRKIVGSIPRVIGSLIKGTGKLVKAGAQGVGFLSGAAIGTVASIGANAVDSASLLLMGKVANTLDRIADNTEKPKEERKNGWLSRIKLFGKKEEGEGGKKKGFVKGVAEFMRNHPSLSLSVGVAAMVALMKSLNITTDDVKGLLKGVWSGIKGVGKVLGWIGSGIYGIVNAFLHPIDTVKNIGSGIGNWFKGLFGGSGANNATKEADKIAGTEGGDSIIPQSKSEAAGMGLVGLIASYFGWKMGKGVFNIGKGIFNAGKGLLKGGALAFKAGKSLFNVGEKAVVTAATRAGGSIASTASTATTAVTKAGKGFLSKLWDVIDWGIKKAKSVLGWALPSRWFETMAANGKLYFKKLVNALPTWNSVKAMFDRIIKKAGAKKLATAGVKKFATKLAVYVAGAATGVGLVAVLGSGLWDLCWILKYWLVDDESFINAVAHQYLGVENLFDNDDIDGSKEEKMKSQPLDDKAKQELYKDPDLNQAPNLNQDPNLANFKFSSSTTLISKSDPSKSITIDNKGNVTTSISKPSNNPDYKPNKTTTSGSLANIQKQMNAANNLNSKNRRTGASPDSISASGTKAELAASFIDQAAGTKSQGRCAAAVRDGLVKAGFPFISGINAADYAKPNGTNSAPGSGPSISSQVPKGVIPMEYWGFKRLDVSPWSYDPQVGDVSITDKGSWSKYGHIAMYTKDGWVSDFKHSKGGPIAKNQISVYKGKGLTGSKADQNISVWRYSDEGIGGGDCIDGESCSTSSSYNDATSKSSVSLGSTSNLASPDMSRTNSILEEQLQVQKRMSETLDKILENTFNLGSQSNSSIQGKPLPQPALGLARKTYA